MVSKHSKDHNGFVQKKTMSCFQNEMATFHQTSQNNLTAVLKTHVISLLETTRSIFSTYKYLWLLYGCLNTRLWLVCRILEKGILLKRKREQEIVDSSKWRRGGPVGKLVLTNGVCVHSMNGHCYAIFIIHYLSVPFAGMHSLFLSK